MNGFVGVTDNEAGVAQGARRKKLPSEIGFFEPLLRNFTGQAKLIAESSKRKEAKNRGSLKLIAQSDRISLGNVEPRIFLPCEPRTFSR
jgi:hypothetical protein